MVNIHTLYLYPAGTKCKVRYPPILSNGLADIDEFHSSLDGKIVEICGYSPLTHDYVVKLPDDFKYDGFDYSFTSISCIYLSPMEDLQ